MDPFAQNILGVQDLIETEANKVASGFDMDEGVTSDAIDELDLDMTDGELIDLKRGYESKSAPYTGRIEPRQKANRTYLFGTQLGGSKTAPSNLLFQSTATFVPQALAKNPEPVVWSDDTPEGKEASKEIKTMLQFHADTLCMRKKLGVMVWHWSVYFTGCLKYGWNPDVNDVSMEVRNPRKFKLDPDGYVDEYGDYHGEFLGDPVECSASELVRLFPGKKELISKKVGYKMGTLLTRTEWWNDEYCFTTLEDEILDKHKNPFFNYEEGKPNHFAKAKMPYTFLSVFSLQEQPHDFTNLIEQNIANQDSIVTRDYQIEKNLAHGNNSIIVDDKYFTAETAHQAALALENGDPVLGNPEGVKRIPANPLPQGILEAQESAKNTLLGVYGTQGVTPEPGNRDTTARGMILNQSFDSTRIGGGVGDALEQVADNAFNWLVQLYSVFYDEKHYAAIMGSGRAVEYVGLMMEGKNRQFVVSVSPNSMKPRDELSQHNLAMQRWESKAIDPIGLMKEIDSADPVEDAKRLVIWTTNPQLYLQQYFPDVMQQPADSANPPQPPQAGEGQPAASPSTLSADPASSRLSNVPLPS